MKNVESEKQKKGREEEIVWHSSATDKNLKNKIL